MSSLLFLTLKLMIQIFSLQSFVIYFTPVFKHSQKGKNVQNQWLPYQVTAHMWPSYGAIYKNFNLALFEKSAFDVLALSTRAFSKMSLYEAKLFCGSSKWKSDATFLYKQAPIRIKKVLFFLRNVIPRYQTTIFPISWPGAKYCYVVDLLQ